jgi:outer membrane receptor protein involved in Fe transport
MQATLNPSRRTPWPASAAAVFALGSASAGTWAQSPELTRVEITGQRVISTASRLDEDLLRVPFSATVVDRAQMDAAGAKTLEDALRTVPGLQHGTQGNYFTRFETRGLRDTQDVLVLIDGVPLRLLQGNADVTLLAPDLVERVEFIKGPASAVYGKNAIGGVVQFFLKPEAAGGRASLTAGSFGRKDGSVRQRWDLGSDAHVFAGAAYSHVDGFQRGTPRQQSAAVLSGDVKLGSRWTSGAQIYASKVNANRGSIIPLANGEPMFGITQRDNFAIPGVYIEGEFVSLAWKNELRFTPGLSLQHISSFARYDRLFQGGITIVPPPAAVSKGYSETDTADRGFFHDLALRHRLVGAAGWSSTTLLGLNLESGRQDQASPTFSNAPTYRGPDYNTPVSNVGNDPRGIRGASTASHFDQRVQSVYLQNRLERGAFGLTTGVRHDRFEQSLQRSDTGVVARQEAARTSPRVGLDWQLGTAAGGEHATFANWTEGFRPQAVALNTRSGVVVPALLRPERTRSVEAGVKGRADDDRWSYQLSLFQADKVDGQRSFRTGPDTFIFSNATSRVKGLESQLQWRLAPAWSGYAHYTWQDARLRDFQTFTAAGVPSTNFAGYRVRMSARHIAGLGVTWSQGPWSLGASANHVGARFLRDNVVNPQLLPAYTVTNLVATWRATPMLTVQGGIDNLADTFYINDDLSAQEAGNAGAPRSGFLRVRLQF